MKEYSTRSENEDISVKSSQVEAAVSERENALSIAVPEAVQVKWQGQV